MVNFFDQGFKHSAFCIGGLPFHGVTLHEASKIVNDAVDRRQRIFLSTPNLDWMRISSINPEFRTATLKSDLFVADGFPVVLIGKILGLPLTERVAGSDLIESLMKMEGDPIRVFFFGGEDGAGKRAFDEVNRRGGRLMAVGHLNPGFGTIEDMSSPEIIEFINKSEPDFLVVSLGSIKGQLWIERNIESLNATVISHLGAVINFFAGSVKRAPIWMQRYGLEWVWRISQEPKLLGRYLKGFGFLLKYLTRVASYKIYMHKSGASSGAKKSPGIVEVLRHEGQVKIKFSGNLFMVDTSKVLSDIGDILDGESEIIVDLEACEYMGPGFIGFILRLFDFCNKKSISTTLSVNRGIESELFFSGAEYLLAYRSYQTELVV